jgi:hypothetical protein
LLCFGIRKNKASTSEKTESANARSGFRASACWQSFKQGCSLHWFDFTLLKIKERGRAGSEGSFSRQRASSKHLLLSKWEASLYQRKPLRASLSKPAHP